MYELSSTSSHYFRNLAPTGTNMQQIMSVFQAYITFVVIASCDVITIRGKPYLILIALIAHVYGKIKSNSDGLLLHLMCPEKTVAVVGKNGKSHQ